MYNRDLSLPAGPVKSLPSFQNLHRVFGVDVAGATPDGCCGYDVPKEEIFVSFTLNIHMALNT